MIMIRTFNLLRRFDSSQRTLFQDLDLFFYQIILCDKQIMNLQLFNQMYNKMSK